MNFIKNIIQVIKKIGIWLEIVILTIVNIGLLIAIISVYKFSTRLHALLLFILFLGIGIVYSFLRKFEKSNIFLSKKGKTMMFLKSCLPYMLQTMFFSQCSLLIGWILLNL